MTAKERTRLWRLANPKRARESCKNWQKKNRERVAAANKIWRTRNAAKIKRRRQLDAPRQRQNKKMWALNNPFKLKMGYVRRMLRRAGCPEIEITKAMLAWAAFAGICHACNTACSRVWVTDHDHTKLTFRGIVGNGCNHALGKVQYDPNRLRALASYLESHS